MKINNNQGDVQYQKRDGLPICVLGQSFSHHDDHGSQLAHDYFYHRGTVSLHNIVFFFSSPRDCRPVVDSVHFKLKQVSLLWRDSLRGCNFHSSGDCHANTVTSVEDTDGNIFGGFRLLK
jgi:hypothetical protein